MQLEQFNYDNKSVRNFGIATIVWGIVGMTVGLLIALQLVWPELNFMSQYTTFGRIRPLHTNAVIFAFVGNAIFMGVYYSMQRVLKARMYSDVLTAIHFWGWQLIIVAAAITLPLGFTTSHEYAELESLFRESRWSIKRFSFTISFNDFATMEEAVYRRYKRVLDEGQPLPQLIVIDGGKGQLGAALKSLRLLGIEKKLTVIGIAKRLEELFYPGDQYPLYLDKKSETLKVIQHLRDEAHRFGITFHRNQRSRKTFVSDLDNIPGIGKVTVEKLLTAFRSVKKIKSLSDEELNTVLNQKQIKALRAYFDNN